NPIRPSRRVRIMTLGCRHRRLVLLALLSAAALPTAAALVAADGASSDDKPDPVPIRRVLLPPERLAAEMERAQQGLLVQLSRPDYEARVRSPAPPDLTRQAPPRLIEARYYRVKMKDSSLVGSAEWKVLKPGAAPAVLSLPSPGVALRQVRWSDGKAALLGDL